MGRFHICGRDNMDQPAFKLTKLSESLVVATQPKMSHRDDSDLDYSARFYFWGSEPVVGYKGS